MTETAKLNVPEGWNVHRDLVVLVGSGVADEAHAWIAIGQQRLIVYTLHDGLAPELPYPAMIVRTRPDVLQTINNYPGNPAKRVALRTANDPQVTPELMRELGERVTECLKSRSVHVRTYCLNGASSLEHCFLNARTVASIPSVASMGQRFKGKPCIIVSPGPSLSKNLHLIKQLKGHAILMTGTHALASFESIDVAPDILLAADPRNLARHYEGRDLSQVQAMVASISAKPYNFETAAKRNFTFAANPGSDDWIFEAFEEHAHLSTGGSVACSAFSLAYHLGCDPIVMVGQDLSFPDGKYYADENLDGDARAVIDDDGRFHLRKPGTGSGEVASADSTRFTDNSFKTIEIPGYHGGTVTSSDSFRTFLFWYEACIEQLQGERRVWNCTEGGARIAGAEQRTLAEAADDILAAPGISTDELSDALDQCINQIEPRERHAQLNRYLDSLLAQLTRCEELATQAQQVLPDAYENGAALSQFEALERELRDAIRPLRLIALIAQREIIVATENAQQATDYEANLTASGRLIEIFAEAAAMVRAPLEAAIERMR